MARSSTTLKAWIGLSILGALSVAFAAGWWLSPRSQSVEVDPLGSKLGSVQEDDPVEEVRPLEDQLRSLEAENDDLRKFIDEVYALLAKEGIHIQLDLEIDENGRYRLKADSAKLIDTLKATLQELNQNRNEASPDN